MLVYQTRPDPERTADALQRHNQYRKNRFPTVRVATVLRVRDVWFHWRAECGKLHARFGQRGEETWLWGRLRHRRMAKVAGNGRLPFSNAGAPLLDST